MTDFSHLDALELGLSHERARFNAATKPGERALRAVWVSGLEREVAAERKFLGLDATPASPMSDDDLLAELGA